MEEKICESCGMPMIEKDDFGGGLTDNKYCKYCTHPDGKLRSYEENVKGFAAFVMKTQDLKEEQAIKMVKEGMSKMPAWKDIKN